MSENINQSLAQDRDISNVITPPKWSFYTWDDTIVSIKSFFPDLIWKSMQWYLYVFKYDPTYSGYLLL